LFENSRALYERARRVIPTGVTSCMRALVKPVPIFIDYGRGSRFYDVDGTEYIDYALAHGPLILGHCHPRLVAAVEKQLQLGSTFGCQIELEPRVAEQILQVLPWADRVIFNSTGTEAVQSALRVARAASGRNLVIKFEGAYHGWADSVLVGHRHKQPLHAASNALELLGNPGQCPSVLHDILIVPWNDPAALESVFAELGDQVAAVITEPMQCNTASIVPQPGYLKLLRELTTRHRSVLIFDEVITGFRLAPGGASEYFGIQPDLAVFGKAVAGGYPLSAVVGTEAALGPVEDGRVRHFGTFNGNPIAMAAAAATLEILLDPAEDVYRRMHGLGTRLMEGLRALSCKEVPLLVQGVPTCFHLLFTDRPAIRNYSDFAAYDMAPTRRWLEGALLEGVFQMGDARWYVSAVHTDEDIALTLERAGRVLMSLASQTQASQSAGS
jgi:glutamate-1-semialdehyde 2,1-aminomutase